ncbi:MAG: cache domain-containing protein [Anaerolineales bacterium]|nr:cache domain-containing protein [Anaerolineales bacterium]
MNAVRKLHNRLYPAPFQFILVISFSLVAALTISIGTWVITTTVNNYLTGSMKESIDYAFHLAKTVYENRGDLISGTARQLANDPTIIANIISLEESKQGSGTDIKHHLPSSAQLLNRNGDYVIAILDKDGTLISGLVTNKDGQNQFIEPGSQWEKLSVVQKVLNNSTASITTEVIPGKLLSQINLENKAWIEIKETPKADPELFDTREGSAGLALMGLEPILNETQETIGAVMVFHLLNNDFTLVDQIKDAAQIDTVTIFMGDLRVSTNVIDPEGKRAIGTRMSEEVANVVLEEGKPFTGTAFVVDQDYITHYEPIHNQRGEVIGCLYVGNRQITFFQLLNTIRERIILVACVTILLTFLLATPVSRRITRPLLEIRELAHAIQRVQAGDMTTRVSIKASGEVGELAISFNDMLGTIQTTQDQLIQSEKLASLGQLAAGVAHELNNPLAIILLYSEIIQKEEQLKPQQLDDLKTIITETKRCKVIVASLLEFARQQQVSVSSVDINALIQSIVDIKIQHKYYPNIEIALELDPDLPVIECDPNQIRGVLINLMENSIDAMSTRGKLTLRTHNNPTGMITIEVIDTGSGISPENMGKIFTPFFTTKPVGSGTGLGLAISYGVIKMHRGNIQVSSQVNQGTTFSINLPIKLPFSFKQETNTKSPGDQVIG